MARPRIFISERMPRMDEPELMERERRSVHAATAVSYPDLLKLIPGFDELPTSAEKREAIRKILDQMAAERKAKRAAARSSERAA